MPDLYLIDLRERRFKMVRAAALWKGASSVLTNKWVMHGCEG
jgi:hypothetical protein